MPEMKASRGRETSLIVRCVGLRLRVSRFRGRFVSADYVGPVCNTPSVRGEQDFLPMKVNGH